MIVTDKTVFVEKQWKYSDDATEMLGIYTANLNTALIACYVPSTTYDYNNTVNALEELREFLNAMNEDTNIVIYGDFNLNCLTYERNSDEDLEPMIIGGPLEEKDESEISGSAANRALANKLIEISDEFSLVQILEKPTFRKQEGNGNSYLDRMFTNITIRSEVEHTESNKTRHDVLKVKMEVSINREDEEIEQIEVLNTKKVDYEGARKELQQVRWDEILIAEKAYEDMEKNQE